MAKTDAENPNDPNHSKICLTHNQEDQSEVRAEDEKVELNLLGKPVMYEQTPVGVAIGLAITSIDGLAWYVKTTLIEEGEDIGCLHVLGRQVAMDTYLSAYTAYTFAKQILLQKQSDNTFFANSNLSIHFPSVNVKGQSAGCTITTSLLSLAMKKPVRKDLAMSGVITETGRILLVTGVSVTHSLELSLWLPIKLSVNTQISLCQVKEKTISARRSQVKTIIFPEANSREFDELGELDDNMKEGLDVHFVDEYEQIFKLAFGYDHH